MKRFRRDTYSVECVCTNCGHTGTRIIQKGERVDSCRSSHCGSECPECGCWTFFKLMVQPQRPRLLNNKVTTHEQWTNTGNVQPLVCRREDPVL